MTLPVFPALAGQGWSVHKKPAFATTVASHVSGREVRGANYVNPVWNFELSFDALDGAGQYGGLGAQSLQSLMGLFLQARGKFGAFVYYDPTDYLVSGQGFGTGDGATISFALTRALGGFVEPVIAPVLAPTTLFAGAQAVLAPAPTIFVGGAAAASGSYSITDGVVSFATAPGAGAALSWSGCFGFLCRFDGDDLDFEQFMANLWSAQSVKFRSLRAQ